MPVDVHACTIATSTGRLGLLAKRVQECNGNSCVGALAELNLVRAPGLSTSQAPHCCTSSSSVFFLLPPAQLFSSSHLPPALSFSTSYSHSLLFFFPLLLRPASKGHCRPPHRCDPYLFADTPFQEAEHGAPSMQAYRGPNLGRRLRHDVARLLRVTPPPPWWPAVTSDLLHSGQLWSGVGTCAKAVQTCVSCFSLRHTVPPIDTKRAPA